jgi:cell division protein FtsB
MVDELRRLHAEVRELNAEVRLLRRDNNGANAEMVTQAKRQTRIALKWDTIGMPATAAPAEG